MDAATAKKRTEKAKAKQYADEQAERKRKQAAIQRERERALRDDFPKKLEECHAKIETESSKGRNKVTISTSSWNGAVTDKIIDMLSKEGYNVSRDYWEGYEDYGDFNAPCRVWESRSWIDVSW